MSRVVIDASISLSWLFEDESNEYADRVLNSAIKESILVPSHWMMEVSNAILMAVKRNRVSEGSARKQLSLLEKLPIIVDSRTSEMAVTKTFSLAIDHRLTVYDAAYLELCLREKIPLATLDEQLEAAAKVAGAILA